MAYPLDTAVETAIGTIELVLKENPAHVGNRESVGDWRRLLKDIELRAADGATGYGALTQTSDANWIAEQNFGVS